jgi:hypothetical protein
VGWRAQRADQYFVGRYFGGRSVAGCDGRRCARGRVSGQGRVKVLPDIFLTNCLTRVFFLDSLRGLAVSTPEA